jgi:hypothetical protein
MFSSKNIRAKSLLCGTEIYTTSATVKITHYSAKHKENNGLMTSFLYKFPLKTFSVASSIRRFIFQAHQTVQPTFIRDGTRWIGQKIKKITINLYIERTPRPLYKKHEIPLEYRNETCYKSLTFNFRQQIIPCSRLFLG